ncbi:MAG: putative dienelactone hydrolase [Candidatus Aldehydirespiratoraceae bacterium]|jgi:predicted dienelactone hydrolase
MRRLTGFVAGSLLLVTACSSGSGGVATTDTAAPATDAEEAPETTDTEAEPAVTDPPVTDPPSTEPAVTDPPVTDPPVDGPPLAAFAPIGDGEYAVGVQTITITDPARDRPLTVDVTFPLAEGAIGEAQRYTFVTGDFYESPRAVAATADQISPDGPFPLVVYSHGSGGLRFFHSDYTETLASHGYVVVSADHAGNTTVDGVLGTSDDSATIAYNRPRDIQVMIDEMLNPESIETVGFVASVDPEQIAVSGHSLGGYATYAVVSGMGNEAGTIVPDDRIGALIPHAPALGDGDPESSLLVAEQLANVDVPTLVMVGTADEATPGTPNVDRAVAETSSEIIYRVDLVEARHQSFTDGCAYLALEDASQVVRDLLEARVGTACTDDAMSADRVNELTSTFAVSFLDSIFESTEMITADNTEIPEDVLFEQK